jgi:hypothetical protein
MTWYKTGTVQVTSGSNAVVGTGTAFIANARVGDAFSGPDGNWYEVINVVSNTSLGIYPNYRGTSVASGGVYVIAPMEGYVKDSADALRAATQVIGQASADASAQVAAATAAATASQNSATAASTSATNAASSATSADSSKVAAKTSEDNAKVSENNAKTSETNADSSKTAAANSAAASANSAAQAATSAGSVANKASSGANGDITSLSGLATPLSLAQGGTGNNNGVHWGQLTGTLSTQADLQTALNAKQDISTSPLIPTAATFKDVGTTANVVLPSGGTYAWWLYQANTSTGALMNVPTSGVSAGGTTVRIAVAGQLCFGFYWKIS